MAKCQHGIENCIHAETEHDDDCCFNGSWTHLYICQDCGTELKSTKFSTKMDAQGMFIAPGFPPKNCPKCKGEKSLV